MKELLIAISGLPRSKKGSKIMAKNKKVEPKQEDTVSRAEFNALAGGVKDLVDLIKSGALTQPAAPTPQEAREEKAVKEAGSNKYTVNPEWEDLAREIIGESMDHTEIQYIKGGGHSPGVEELVDCTVHTFVERANKSTEAKNN